MKIYSENSGVKLIHFLQISAAALSLEKKYSFYKTTKSA